MSAESVVDVARRVKLRWPGEFVSPVDVIRLANAILETADKAVLVVDLDVAEVAAGWSPSVDWAEEAIAKAAQDALAERRTVVGG